MSRSTHSAPQSKGFALKQADGQIDLPAKFLKDIPGWDSDKGWNIAEGYKHGHLNIHLHIGVVGKRPQGVLEFAALDGARVKTSTSHLPLHPNRREVNLGHGDEGDGVLCRVRELAKSAELVIATGVGVPSRVDLKPFKELVQRRRVSRIILNPLGEVGRMAPDGEVNFPRLATAHKIAGGANGVIGGVFDLPQGISGELSELIRQGGYDQLELFALGVRVYLSEHGVRFTAEGFLANGIEILDVCVRPAQ